MIRRLAYLVAISLILFSGCSLKRNSNLLYNFKASLDSLKILHVSAILELKCNKDSSCMKLNLKNYANNIKIFDKNNVSINYIHTSDTLIVLLKSIKGITQLKIDYELPVDSFKVDSVFYLARSAKWIPFVYDNIYDLSMDITLPKKYAAYSSCFIDSVSDNNKTTYKFHNVNNTSFPLIIAPSNFYTQTSKTISGYKFDYFFYSKDSVCNRMIIDESIRAFFYCNSKIGKEEIKQKTFIECPEIQYVQSHRGFITIGTDFIKNYRLPEYKFWPSHEMIHQWIGSGIEIPLKNGDNDFTCESFTEFIRFLYMKDMFGSDSLDYQLRYNLALYDQFVKGTKSDVAINKYVNNGDAVDLFYNNAPIFLYYLFVNSDEKKIRNMIKSIYSSYYNKYFTLSDFHKILSENVKDKKLMSKFDYFLDNKGISKDVRDLIPQKKK